MKPNEKKDPAAPIGQPPKLAEIGTEVASLRRESNRTDGEALQVRLQALFPSAPPETLISEVEELQAHIRRFESEVIPGLRQQHQGCRSSQRHYGIVVMPGGERLVAAQIPAYKPRGNDTIVFMVDSHEEVCTLPPSDNVKAQRDELLEVMDNVMEGSAVDLAASLLPDR